MWLLTDLLKACWVFHLLLLLRKCLYNTHFIYNSHKQQILSHHKAWFSFLCSSFLTYSMNTCRFWDTCSLQMQRGLFGGGSWTSCRPVWVWVPLPGPSGVSWTGWGRGLGGTTPSANCEFFPGEHREIYETLGCHTLSPGQSTLYQHENCEFWAIKMFLSENWSTTLWKDPIWCFHIIPLNQQ